ncbi:MAG: extracellular solute-binding protein [Lachnospiraceae bacterium]|nr:extracellular solute-binding protein [Lachnospiraceae bacterium]
MKKLMALLLCIILVFAGLTGCANSGTTTQAPTAAPTKATSDPTEAPTEKATGVPTNAPTEEGSEKGVLPLTTERKVITVGIPLNAQTEDYDTNAYTLWLEEQTGVDLEFVYFSSNSSERTTQLNLMVASSTDKLPDVIVGWAIGASLRNELGEDGYLLDLTDYFDQYAYWYWEMYDLLDEEAKKMVFTQAKDPTNGALYTVPGAFDFDESDTIECPAVINKKWLETLGLSVPTTVDELYDVLVAFRDRDPNGNGKNDEIPMTGGSMGWGDIAEFVINAYVYCNDKYRWNATDGQIWSPYTTPEYREALVYLNKLYQEGLLSPLFFSTKKNPELKALTTPTEGPTITGVTCGHTLLIYEAENDLMDEYTALPPLKAETSLGGYSPQQTFTYSNNMFITCDAEDPVLCFKLLDFMSGLESFPRQRYGEYGVDWTYAPESEWGQNSTGHPAKLYLLQPNVWNEQNNQTWHTLTPKSWASDAGFFGISTPDPTSWSYRNEQLCMEIWRANRAAGMPEEVVWNLVYNTDESQVVSDYNATVHDYVEEARALFIAGTLNPSSDADWSTYLKTLEEMGMSKLIEAVQSSYTRMNAE